jgi:hypothetical protein
MKHIIEIYQVNGQDPKHAYQRGSFEFNEMLGGLVYVPPVVMAERKADADSDDSESIRKAS